MRKLLTIICTAAVLLIGVTEGWSNEFQKGWDAFNIRDYAAALKKWRAVAEQGLAEAQFNLGLIYDNGLGVTEDNQEAVKWYRRAAEQGLTEAQNNLGLMYEKGEGISEDDQEAAKWFRRAAEQQHAKAQANLGFIHANGKGVLQNYVLAHMWSNIAASNGNKTAGENIEIFEEKMSASQIQRAQKLAIECVEKNYKGC